MAMRTSSWALAGLTSAAFAAGCIGTIGGDDEAGPMDGPGVSPECALDMEVRPGLRLSSSQYVNAVRDLFGVSDFEAELEDEPGLITKRAVRQLSDAAASIVARRADWTEEVFPCDTAGTADLACLDAFIDGFGSKIFRRPLSEGEGQRLHDAYDAARDELDFDGAMEVVLQVMLQSPEFVYLFEDGLPEASGAVRLLSDHEVASRLSFLLWHTTPDTELLDAAAAGELSTVEGLNEQTERLLAHDKSKDAFVLFIDELMQLNGGHLHYPLEEVTKDDVIYPEVDASLLAAMRIETNALIERVMFEGSGDFAELWTSRDAYVNGPLAAVYGVSGPADASTFEWVTLSDDRAGLLTRAAFLTTFSTATVTAPIRRGVWIREHLLCDELGEPPENIDDSPIDGGEVENENGEVEVVTVREATDARTMNEQPCISCHSLINPLGYAFEGFDAIGREQLTEVVSGAPVDTETEVTNTDFDGTIADARHMSEALADSAKARTCFAHRWQQRALGGEPPDACSSEVTDAFVATGNMRELVVAMVASDAFRYVNVGE